MGIEYFNCDACGLEMNDCYCDVLWWACTDCDETFCENCVRGRWQTRLADRAEFCESCAKQRLAIEPEAYGCFACHGGSECHTPGCPVGYGPESESVTGAATAAPETSPFRSALYNDRP